MKDFQYQMLLEDSYHKVKVKFGKLANIGSIEQWIQFQLASELSVNIGNYSAGDIQWQATWDIGHATKPDIDIWPIGSDEHYLFQMKTLWNNNSFLPAINKRLAKDIKHLKKMAPLYGFIVVFPVFYCGSPDLAQDIYGSGFTKKRLIQPDESRDALIERLCAEFEGVCGKNGVQMNEPEHARWYSDNWCGTMRWGLVGR
jgi:hypothetical protein